MTDREPISDALHAPSPNAHDKDYSSSGLYHSHVSQSSSSDSLDAFVVHDSSTQSTSDVARRPALLDEDDQPTATALAVESSTTTQRKKDPPVTWMSLPKKGQLAVLTLARLSEPLSERSLSAYMFYQLRSFDTRLPDSTIASQGGMLTAAFAAAQFITAVWWGRAADSPRIGRKKVILIGLFGTAVASLGVGFSTSFFQALLFRFMAGALNGNVGVMRTMISEIVEERKFQSRAFLLLPMCFNIGVVIGPILGGFLADPISSFPSVFGPGSVLGGKDGVGWMMSFPYSLPNIFSFGFLSLSATAVILGLDETHATLKHKPDIGRRLSKWLQQRCLRRSNRGYDYQQLNPDETELQLTTPAVPNPHDVERPRQAIAKPTPTDANRSTSPFRLILSSRNVLTTLCAHFLLALHVSSFNALIFLFLPAPRAPPSSKPSRFTLLFTGGLGLSSEKVGLATAIIGLIGLPLQILVYPRLNHLLGAVRSYRYFLPFSAVAYTTLPFLALLPFRPYLIWPALTFVLAMQVMARTFALPSTVILINNATPGPECLGTLHGVAQSVSAAARTVGPTIGGWGLGEGLRRNCVGAVWWAMTVVVALNWTLLLGVYEGDGRGGRA